MKKSVFSLMILVCLVMLTACGEPKINATSLETLEASAEKIKASLNGEKKAYFEIAMEFIYMDMGAAAFLTLMDLSDPDYIMNEARMKVKAEEIVRDISKQYHGKTADDILEIYVAFLKQEQVRIRDEFSELNESHSWSNEYELDKLEKRFAVNEAEINKIQAILEK